MRKGLLLVGVAMIVAVIGWTINRGIIDIPEDTVGYIKPDTYLKPGKHFVAFFPVELSPRDDTIKEYVDVLTIEGVNIQLDVIAKIHIYPNIVIPRHGTKWQDTASRLVRNACKLGLANFKVIDFLEDRQRTNLTKDGSVGNIKDAVLAVIQLPDGFKLESLEVKTVRTEDLEMLRKWSLTK